MLNRTRINRIIVLAKHDLKSKLLYLLRNVIEYSENQLNRTVFAGQKLIAGPIKRGFTVYKRYWLLTHVNNK